MEEREQILLLWLCHLAPLLKPEVLLSALDYLGPTRGQCYHSKFQFKNSLPGSSSARSSSSSSQSSSTCPLRLTFWALEKRWNFRACIHSFFYLLTDSILTEGLLYLKDSLLISQIPSLSLRNLELLTCGSREKYNSPLTQNETNTLEARIVYRGGI